MSRITLAGVLSASVMALVACAASAQTALPARRGTDALEEGVRNHPQAAQPHVWWHRMSGGVTEEGARRDLEQMQRMGVGGIHAFLGGREPTVVPRPAPFPSNTSEALLTKLSVRGGRIVTESGMAYRTNTITAIDVSGLSIRWTSGA